MNFKVVGIGEVLWDLLPSGPQLGGAPANFACHARQLGAQVEVITRVGRDDLGRQILSCFKDMNIGTNAVQFDDRLPTGTAVVALDGGTPHFTIHENVAWDCIESSPVALDCVRFADAICFGTLAQRSPTSRSAIQKIVSSVSTNALRVYDVNLRQQYYDRNIIEQSIKNANVLKLNDHELTILTPMFGLTGDVNTKVEQLSKNFSLRMVALTCAERGSLLYETGKWSELPGSHKKVVDTVGAGDSFTAALVIGLLQQMTLGDIHSIAAEIAGFVCSRDGATPNLPLHLRSVFLAIQGGAPRLELYLDSGCAGKSEL